MIVAGAVTSCKFCRSDAAGLGLVSFEHAGVRHAAPETWIVGRRQTLERTGLRSACAVAQACREWAALCVETEVRS